MNDMIENCFYPYSQAEWASIDNDSSFRESIPIRLWLIAQAVVSAIVLIFAVLSSVIQGVGSIFNAKYNEAFYKSLQLTGAHLGALLLPLSLVCTSHFLVEELRAFQTES